MAKLVRNGVFETNSSSCHSLTVSEVDKNYDSITPDHDGCIRVPGYEFGWEEETYYDPMAKLSYVLIYLADWVSDQEAQARMYQMLQRVVFEHTGATALEFENTDDSDTYSYPHGYIDHQSVESRDLDFLFNNGDAYLKSFLFSGSSFIQTDNDNH